MIKFVLGMVVGASIGFLVACLVRANEDREMDLIDRQAAIHDLCKTRCGCEPEECCLTFPEDGAEECADVRWLLSLPSARTEIIRCKDCKHNPKDEWFGCPMSHLSEAQRPETAWCWKAERRTENADVNT